MRIALDDHALGHHHTAGAGNPPHIVAPEVDQHQVLGDLLGIGQQFPLEREILRLRAPAPAGARDRAHGDLFALQPRQHLGRGADDLEIPQIEKEQVRRGVDVAQRPVEIHRVARERRAETLRRHHLHHVAGKDIFADPPHRILVTLASALRDERGFHLAGTRAVGATGRDIDRWQTRRRHIETPLQFVEACLGTRGRIAGARVDRGREQDGAGEVVEHQELFRHQQQDIGRAEHIGRSARGQAPLDQAGTVIAEISDQAAREHWQRRMREHPFAARIILHESQRIIDLAALEQRGAIVHLDPMTTHHDAPRAGQADDRVASPFFAAFHRLEQETAGTGKFQVGAERGFEIGQQAADHRHAAKALAGEIDELAAVHHDSGNKGDPRRAQGDPRRVDWIQRRQRVRVIIPSPGACSGRNSTGCASQSNSPSVSITRSGPSPRMSSPWL